MVDHAIQVRSHHLFFPFEKATLDSPKELIDLVRLKKDTLTSDK